MRISKNHKIHIILKFIKINNLKKKNNNKKKQQMIKIISNKIMKQINNKTIRIKSIIKITIKINKSLEK